MIDLHFHALPGVDDGPATAGEAVALLQAAARAGTRVVVATPHCSARWPTTAASVSAGVADLRVRLAAAGVDVDLRGGAEVTVPMAATLPGPELAALTLGGGGCVLLESPLGPAGAELERTVDALLGRGHRVLLAHPERSPAFLERPQRLRALVDRGGVLCSLTAAALEGRFGDGPRWFGLELLRDGLAHSVDSDAHHATLRPPGVAAGLAAAAAALPAARRWTDWLTRAAPEAILAGAPLPPRPG